MIYKCPNCNGALEYNPAEDKMQCFHCGNNYFMWELDENAVEFHENIPVQSEVDEEKLIDFTKERTIYDETEFMECKVYTCSTCGAELTVNDTEVSTYCAYCGQPTIVYNRVDKTQKPKYIIPFKITKEEAENAIRKRLRKGFLIPKEIKKFEPEKITGIYLPYYLFDVYYYDKQKRNGYLLFNEADCEFVQVGFDASKVVSDELSQALEPYDLSELKEFEAGYLSGFYADRYDLTARQLTNAVVRRCKQMFDNELTRRLELKYDEIIESYPSFKIRKAEYAFFPVWFLTFRYKDKPCTMMVNGQTGKVVGTVPFQRAKVVVIFTLFAILLSSLLAIAGCFVFRMFNSTPMFGTFWLVWFGCFCFAINCITWKKVIKNFKDIKTSLQHTQLKKAERFMMERQGGNL